MLAEKNKTSQLILQQRKTKRKYIYDYHAYIINENGKKDLFGKGGGISIQKEEAKMKAIGEALERYCGSHINKTLRRTSFKKIKCQAVNPKKLVQFKNFQYSSDFIYQKPSIAQNINWVEGYSLVKRKKLFVPAFSVYLGYNRLVTKKEKFAPTTSCGLALQTSLKKATIRATYELIERDAAMVVWLTKKRIPRIDLEKISNPRVIYLKEKILKEGLIPEIGVITIDVPIPSIIGIIYDSKKKIPFVTFGLATEESLEKAIEKSLAEALMIRNSLEILKEKREIVCIKKSSVNNFLKHAIFYAFPSRKKLWKFLLSGPIYSPGFIKKKYGFKENSGYKDLKNIIMFFKKQNKEVIRVNTTNNIVKEMGYVAVKTIIPELQSMNIDYNARFLGGKRLDKFLKRNN